jgi:hypothetical protein
MIRRILPIYYFSLEGFYVFFLTFLFYIKIGLFPPIIPFIAVLVIGNMFLAIALKQESVSIVFPLLGGIIGGFIGYFLGLFQISALLSSLFIYFRILAFSKNESSWTSEREQLVIIFYSSSLLVFFFGWIFQYPFINWLYGMLIAFTALYSIGRFLQQIEGSPGRKNLKGISGVFGIAFIFSGILTLLIPITKLLFVKLLEGLAFLAFPVITPIVNLLKNLVEKGINRRNKGPQEEIGSNMIGKKTNHIANHHHDVSNSHFWIWILLLGIILVIIWLLIKNKNKTKTDKIVLANLVIEHEPSLFKKNRKSRFFRGPAPQEYVRKLIYQLQIYADKNEMGRYEHETVREWFKRLGFPINEEFLVAYENVRYGNGVLARSEATQFEGIITDLKREIKEQSKLKKENEENKKNK